MFQFSIGDADKLSKLVHCMADVSFNSLLEMPEVTAEDVPLCP